MPRFDPNAFQMPCGHFIGGRLVEAQDSPAVHRPFRAMRTTAAGTVWVNCCGCSDDFVIPTGGYHPSGIGKDLGCQAVEPQLRHKRVLLDFGAPCGASRTRARRTARHAVQGRPNGSFVAAQASIHDMRTAAPCCNDDIKQVPQPQCKS